MEPKYRRRLRERDNKPLKPSRWMKLWISLASERTALWAAAIVGAVAIIASTLDSKGVRKQMAAQVTAMSSQSTKMDDQVKAMKQQLAEMRDEQRPWIEIDRYAPERAVIAGGTNLNIDIALHLKNLGKRPALGISLNTRVVTVTQGSFANVETIQEDVCKIAGRMYPRRRANQSLMPDESNVEHLGGVINVQTVLDDTAKELKDRFVKYPVNKATFMLIGCLDYLLSGVTDDHGQTMFVYDISKRGPRNLPWMMDIPFKGTLSAEQLQMTKDLRGNFAR